jgi:hypothetical protein
MIGMTGFERFNELSARLMIIKTRNLRNDTGDDVDLSMNHEKPPMFRLAGIIAHEM